MALRPVPKPRLSKIAKPPSVDVSDSLSAEPSTAATMTTASADHDLFSERNGDDDSLHQQQVLQLPQHNRHSTDHNALFNSESPTTPESTRPVSQISVENPTYETINFRAKSSEPARNVSDGAVSRTSDLIWFPSGMPPDYVMPALPERILEEPVTSPLDTKPDDLPSLNTSVTSLYPKLPPSPIVPISDSIFETSNNTVRYGDQHRSADDQLDSIRNALQDDVDDSTFVSTLAENGHLTFSNLNCSDDEKSATISTFTDALEHPLPNSDDSLIVNPHAEPVMESIITSVVEPAKLVPVGSNICYFGWLTKCGAKKKDSVRRWCVLKNGVFTMFENESCTSSLGSVACKAILMVMSKNVSDCPIGGKESGFLMSCVFDGRKLENWVFTSDDEEEIAAWLALLTKSIVRGEAADLCEAVDRAGPMFLKKGTTAEWAAGSLVMRGKTLLYASEGDECGYEVDIRKVFRIRIVIDQADFCSLVKTANPAAFVISTDGSALYVQSDQPMITNIWREAIETALLERTGSIAEQRLTADDIPIIVEKCISFIAVHGLYVEGIYRLSGTSTKVKQLFEEFMKDPHSVHFLMPGEYAVHDVASVLKKFFRQLNEPLITAKLRPRFIEKSGLDEHGSRIIAYKGLLQQLPLVNYNTMRKILRHLKGVAQYSSKNMMTVQNLAAIFGSTLFSVDEEIVEGNNSFVSTSQAIMIIADMIIYYERLFDVGELELKKEQEIQAALERIERHTIKRTSTARSILLSIHVFEKDGNVFNMEIENKVTAGQVCEFVVSHRKLSVPASQLALYEVVCNGQLERVLFPEEKLLDVISRWTTWALEERATNYVVVKLDNLKERCESLSGSLMTSCDVSYSESKPFKKCTLQFSKGEVLQFKNSKAKKPLQRWAVEKILWFFGCEVRRQPPTHFSLTFITDGEKIQRTKGAPFFGRCICFKDEADRLKWLMTVTLPNRSMRANF